MRELSERTTAYFLDRKQCLAEREIALLRQLDPTVVSRFVGPYLLAVDDQPKAEPEDFQFGGRTSRHVLLCAVLAEIGTHEALPGLVEAGRRGRLPPPSDDLKYNVGWLAAMAIADRDPWPGLDDWLASLIEMTQPLGTSPDAAPDVGGTAAAMLLERHGAYLCPISAWSRSMTPTCEACPSPLPASQIQQAGGKCWTGGSVTRTASNFPALNRQPHCRAGSNRGCAPCLRSRSGLR